jgi:hypothetical protein
MHYEVRFVGSHSEKTAQAWEACKGYLETQGMARLADVTQVMAKQPRHERANMARLFCLFNGIGGRYPERAILAYVLGLVKE